MLEREPSRTAFGAAAYRALHQLREEASFFKDPYALPILGIDADALRANPAAGEDRRGVRFWVVARSAIAEDILRHAVEQRGVGQLVVLGAGLDTFAYRNPFEGRLKVFEVDHPATQAWKRRRLADAGIPIPDSLTYAPVDFERENLTDRLAAAGVDPLARTAFTWLGVVPYLTQDAITATLTQIAAHPGGAEVVFDYAEPREDLDPALRAIAEERLARVAAIGEPLLSFFKPADLHDQLSALGFTAIDDLDLPGVVARLTCRPPQEGARRTGGHLLFAATHLPREAGGGGPPAAERGVEGENGSGSS